MQRDMPSVGAPDPELRSSPILDGDEEESLDAELRSGRLLLQWRLLSDQRIREERRRGALVRRPWCMGSPWGNRAMRHPVDGNSLKERSRGPGYSAETVA